jgi:cobalt-zinc-cadmium efflux system outer membrane protein
VLDDLQRAASGRLIPFTDVIQARRTLDELLVEEADSYSDSFQTSVDLIAEMGPRTP